MTKNAIAIIQARMSSKRLPGKVLMDLAGKPMLWHIYHRLKNCKYVDEIVIATSKEKSDDKISNFCHQVNWNCYRGSLNNVYERFIEILERKDFPYFVRVTGDSPLIYPEFIDKQIIALRSHNCDIVWLAKNSSLLAGQGVQSSKSLINLKKIVSSKEDKEHVASVYISNNPEKFKIIGLNPPQIFIGDKFRVSVDEIEDYEMMKILYEQLWNKKTIEINNAINWMLENIQISQKNLNIDDSNINKEVKRKINSWSSKVKDFCDWNDPSILI